MLDPNAVVKTPREIYRGIIAKVERKYFLPAGTIMKKSKARIAVNARYEAATEIWQLNPHMTLDHLARVFGCERSSFEAMMRRRGFSKRTLSVAAE